MRIKTVNTILYCEKWKDTVDFYKNVLKFDVNFSNEWFVEFNLISGARISIANEEMASIKGSKGKGITIGFQIANIHIIHNHLVESGINPTPIKVVWGSSVFYVYDPEGNRIEFWS